MIANHCLLDNVFPTVMESRTWEEQIPWIPGRCHCCWEGEHPNILLTGHTRCVVKSDYFNNFEMLNFAQLTFLSESESQPHKIFKEPCKKLNPKKESHFGISESAPCFFFLRVSDKNSLDTTDTVDG